MNVGVHIVRFPWPAGTPALRQGLRRVAEAAEAAGAYGISFMDHLINPPGHGAADLAVLEGYSALAFVAALTERVRLRLLVTGVTYRHPGVLVKTLTTLDALSAGRAELGLGAAWYEREHRALGVEFPPVAERFERLEDVLQLCHHVWDGDRRPFVGRHYRLEEPLFSPPPVGRPRPRIIVGGAGERRTLALAARYADASNIFAVSPQVVARKVEVLRRHCEAAGRPPGEVALTAMYRGHLLADGRADAFVGLMARYARLGMSEIVVVPPGPRPAAWIRERLAPVVPRLAEVGPS